MGYMSPTSSHFVGGVFQSNLAYTRDPERLDDTHTAPKPDGKQPMVASHCNRKMQPMHCLLVILALVMLLASDKNTANGANFRVKKDLRKGLRAQQATKQGEPWMDGAQDYPDLQVSDEALADIASPDQKYDDPMAPPVWLAHKDLEPPGLPPDASSATT